MKNLSWIASLHYIPSLRGLDPKQSSKKKIKNLFVILNEVKNLSKTEMLPIVSMTKIKSQDGLNL
ncbi:hypothetical protein [Dysgonomonas reticulitermitis]